MNKTIAGLTDADGQEKLENLGISRISEYEKLTLENIDSTIVRKLS